MKINKSFILKIFALAIISVNTKTMNHQDRYSIGKSIARQAGAKRCDKRVTRWYEFDTNSHFYADTKTDEKPGVLAFHTYPLAATCFLKKFKFKYNLSSDSVSSTPGIIKFETSNNNATYKPVAFEVGVNAESVIHRAATTRPSDPMVVQAVKQLQESSNEWVKYMKTVSERNAKCYSKDALFPDQSYIVVADKEKGIVITKNNTNSVEALIFINR